MVGVTASDDANNDDDKDTSGSNGVEVLLESAMVGVTASDVGNDEDDDEENDATGPNSVEVSLESAMVGVTACDDANDDDDEDAYGPNSVEVLLEIAMVGITVSDDTNNDDDKDASGPDGVEVPLEIAMVGVTACDDANTDDNKDASGPNSVEVLLESAMVSVTACDAGNDEEKDETGPILDADTYMDDVKCNDDVKYNDGAKDDLVTTLSMIAFDLVTELTVLFLVCMEGPAGEKVPTDVEKASKDDSYTFEVDMPSTEELIAVLKTDCGKVNDEIEGEGAISISVLEITDPGSDDILWDPVGNNVPTTEVPVIIVLP